MTDINLKDFDKNNWDEFVHLRALKDVINQENAINNEQNQQITQNTNDVATAKQEAEGAKNTAESAENTANEAKATADGLNDKVDTAQSTAEDAKNTADNASKIAGMAQNTASQLGAQVSQLDGTVIKKGNNEEYTFGADTTLTCETNTNISGKLSGYVFSLVTDTGEQIPLYSGSLMLTVHDNIAGILSKSSIQLTLSKPTPDIWHDKMINGTIMINDGKSNIFTGLVGVKFIDTTHVEFWLVDYEDSVFSNFTWAQDSSTSYQLMILLNDIA